MASPFLLLFFLALTSSPSASADDLPPECLFPCISPPPPYTPDCMHPPPAENIPYFSPPTTPYVNYPPATPYVNYPPPTTPYVYYPSPPTTPYMYYPSPPITPYVNQPAPPPPDPILPWFPWYDRKQPPSSRAPLPARFSGLLLTVLVLLSSVLIVC